jgi:hypothetical protein
MAIEALLEELRSRGEHETYPPAIEEDVGFLLQEVSAVGSGNRQVGPIQYNAAAYGGGHIPFSLAGNGNAWCFMAGEGEIAVAHHDTETGRFVGELPSFEAWLEILIREQDEVIRALGFTDELRLG